MFFSLLKSKLQKKQGLYYEDLNNNIKEVIKTIPEGYYNKILYVPFNIYCSQLLIINMI